MKIPKNQFSFVGVLRVLQPSSDFTGSPIRPSCQVNAKKPQSQRRTRKTSFPWVSRSGFLGFFRFLEFCLQVSWVLLVLWVCPFSLVSWVLRVSQGCAGFFDFSGSSGFLYSFPESRAVDGPAKQTNKKKKEYRLKLSKNR